VGYLSATRIAQVGGTITADSTDRVERAELELAADGRGQLP
jgi:hypothetical protein